MAGKKVEIDESVLANQGAIIALVNDIQKDPNLRGDFLKAVKKVRPDMPIPEIDAAAPIQAKLDELSAKQDAFFAKLEEEKAARAAESETNKFMSQWNDQKQTLLKRGYYEKMVDKIEAFAKQEQIPNLLAAAAYYDQVNPPSLTSTKGGMFDAFNDAESDDGKYLKALMDSRAQPGGVINDNAVMHLAQNALNDIRAANRG
jgi:hypothetical protein